MQVVHTSTPTGLHRVPRGYGSPVTQVEQGSGRLGAAPSFWVVAAAFAVVTVGGTLPAPLYVLWQAEDGFGSATVTLVFAAYSAGILLALLLAGRLSDALGRRALLVPALAFSAVSSLAFALGGGLASLYVGRLLSGVSVGLVTSAATAALAELEARSGGGPRRAVAVSTAANLGGLATGAVLAGALAQYVARPTVTAFALHVVLAVLAGAGLLAVQETVRRTGPVRLRPQRLALPGAARAAFAVAGPASFLSLGLLGLFTSLGPGFVLTTLGDHDHLVAGVVAGSAYAAATVAQLGLPGVPPLSGVRVGLVVMPIGLLLTVLGLGAPSLTLLLTGAVVGGLGAGLAFRGSIALLSSAVPAERRAEVLTSVFVTAYAGLSVPVLGLGLATRSVSSVHAAWGFAAVLSAVSVGTLILTRRPAGVSR